MSPSEFHLDQHEGVDIKVQDIVHTCTCTCIIILYMYNVQVYYITTCSCNYLYIYIQPYMYMYSYIHVGYYFDAVYRGFSCPQVVFHPVGAGSFTRQLLMSCDNGQVISFTITGTYYYRHSSGWWNHDNK